MQWGRLPRHVAGAGAQEGRSEREAIALEHGDKERVAQGLPAAGSFEALAREGFAVRRGSWATSDGDKIIASLEADGFSWIGKVPVAEVTAPLLLEVVRRIEARGVIETAHRALQGSGQVLRHAVATGHATSNPARDLKGALRQPTVKQFAVITEPKRFGELSRVHGAPHLAPLPKQAVAVLRELHALTGHSAMVFRGERHHHRAMSKNTVNAALRAMGFSADEVTGHGFRATARTMLQERLGFDPDLIEAQLAHSVRNQPGRAYNRTEFVGPRRKMMQAWADDLDKLRRGAAVVSPRGPKR